MSALKPYRLWLAITIACTVAMPTICASPAGAAEIKAPLMRPTPDDLAFLAYIIAGSEAPFSVWAEADRTVASQNEFKRKAAAKALEEKMRARSEALKNVRLIHLNLSSEFGEYNDRYSEFDFDMNDGTFVSYATPLRRTGVNVKLINGGLAQTWSLPPGDAEKVVNTVGGNRNVMLSMTLELVGATVPVTNDQPLSIDARVIEYDVVSQRNNLKLGHVVVK